ncbi:MAG: molybdate ABC transporter substrate-binding protein [Kineosporiaceae bacterium]
MTPGPRRAAAVLLLLAVPGTAACGGGADGADEPGATGGPTGGAGVEGEILVAAAASLTDAFEDVADAFEAENRGATVTFTFGPSSGLATQIVEGAPADVAAFASEVTMTTVEEAGAVAGRPRVFATNDLVVVTAPGNPGGITGVADLPDAGIVALCGEDVPCGTLAAEVLDAAGVEIPETSVTRGEDVRATLAAVAQGDAVAGIVYRTDAAAAGDTVATVAIPAGINAVAEYPVAALTGSGNPEAAAAFVDFVLSPPGLDILAEYGFGPPPT